MEIKRTKTAVIHLCSDEAINNHTHHNKQRAHREDVKQKMKLAEQNVAMMQEYIEQTKHLTVLHTLPQITN